MLNPISYMEKDWCQDRFTGFSIINIYIFNVLFFL